jgi:hypothetical protein
VQQTRSETTELEQILVILTNLNLISLVEDIEAEHAEDGLAEDLNCAKDKVRLGDADRWILNIY